MRYKSQCGERLVRLSSHCRRLRFGLQFVCRDFKLDVEYQSVRTDNKSEHGAAEMKKIILVLCVLMVAVISLVRNQPIVPSQTITNSEKIHADLAFAVLGDVHANIDSLEKALSLIFIALIRQWTP